jgi:hypothetical protein
MTQITCEEEQHTANLAKKLSDALLRAGFQTLRAMPGYEKKASGEAHALVSYVQILKAPQTPGYIVRVIPKNASWDNTVQVSFMPHEDKTKVSITASDYTIHLGEDPNFKILLNQVVQSMADVL